MLYWRQNEKSSNNCGHFPQLIRGLIVGSSGSGKTCLLFKLLLDECPVHKMDFLDYDRIVLVSPNLDLPEYQILIKGFNSGLNKKQLLKMFELQREIQDYEEVLRQLKGEKPIITVQAFKEEEKLPGPEELERRTLFIADDVMLMSKNLNKISKFFVAGRPRGIQSILLTQSFHQIPKRTIRDQTNFEVLFKTTPYIIEQIYEQINFDSSKRDFFLLCHDAWREDFSYLTHNHETSEFTKNLGVKKPPVSGGSLLPSKLMSNNYLEELAKYAESDNKLLQSARNAQNRFSTFQEQKAE